MRLYVPATLADLASASLVDGVVTWTVPARTAHAVTEALVLETSEDDEEVLEYEAFLAAAHDSLLLIAAAPDGPLLRVVVTVDVPQELVHTVHDGADCKPAASAMCVHDELPDVIIQALHVDEPEAAADVQAMLDAATDHTPEGDEALEAATLRVEDRALLWYAPEELNSIPRG